MRKNIRKRAYWIFDDGFIAPTFLSVYSFLQWCDIPVVLLYYGTDFSHAEMWFNQLEKDKEVLLVHIDDSFFSLPIFDYNSGYSSSIKNRELRFYVASQSGPNDVTYCFDSDIIFSEKCRELIDLEFDGKPSVFGCKERLHTYENVLYFERGKIHSTEDHIYPECAKDIYDSIFKEDTESWLGNPQLNNGVLIYSNASDLSEVWRKKHEYGLFFPLVNPGEDQVTLVAALSQLKNIEVKYLNCTYNSKGQLNGQYGVYHATGGQWKGEIINALSKETEIRFVWGKNQANAKCSRGEILWQESHADPRSRKGLTIRFLPDSGIQNVAISAQCVEEILWGCAARFSTVSFYLNGQIIG